jgi:hypothetical protein
MVIPPNLLIEMESAWAGPPPTLPAKWSDKSQLELHDIFIVFNRKRWQDFSCEDDPDYFHALTMLLGDSPEAAGYYIASYMRCYFLTTGNAFCRIVDSITLFLDVAMEDPGRSGLSLRRCQVINKFIEIASEHFKRGINAEIGRGWGAMVERLELENK